MKNYKKNITTILLLIVCVTVFGQLKRIDSMLVNIDKTDFTSGILYERTTPWSRIDVFNDSINLSTKSHFEQALHELYKASNEQKFSYYKELRTQYTPKTITNIVDVGIINTTFNELNYVENDETNSALRVTNNKFEKINNAIPIFKTKHAIVISPLKSVLTGNTITFKFNNQFIFQETNKTIQTLTANFDTQQDYTIIQNGSIVANTITVNYTHEGIKTLIFEVVFTDGTTIITSAILKTLALKTPPPLVENYSQVATIPFQNVLGEIEYRIFYHTSNEDGTENTEEILQKPIVIIDGFDPGDKRKIGYLEDNINEKTLVNQMYYNDANDERKNLVAKLRGLGYDVVIVNQITHAKNNVIIDGGADYIERNAMAHVALYQHLNDTLIQNGSNEELVIIGPSMGGQISRYALAYMEKHNIEHNTRLWVSVDSPHLGANIPIGMQAILNLLDIFGDSVDAADFYNDRLKSVAGNQQLIEQHLPNNLPDHLNNGSPVRQQYLSNLTSNGMQGSNGYPQNLRKIAMANGSTIGVDVGIPGEEDFRVHGFINQFWWNVNIVKMYTKYMPVTGGTKQVASLWRALKPFRSVTYTNINPNGSMDIVPGGLYNTEDQVHSAVMDDNPDVFSFNNGISFGNGIAAYAGFLIGFTNDYFESRINKKIHSFVPTVSALGFKNSNFNWSHNINRNLICTNEIPFDNYYAPKINTEHTSFTQESINWLLDELDLDTPNPPPTVYLNNSILTGSNSVCYYQPTTFTLEIGDCIDVNSVSWQVSPGLQIVSSTATSATVMHTSTTLGMGTITAVIDVGNNTHTVSKNVKKLMTPTVSEITLQSMGSAVIYTNRWTNITARYDGNITLDLFEWEWLIPSSAIRHDSPFHSYLHMRPLVNANTSIYIKTRAKNDCGCSDWKGKWFNVVYYQPCSNCPDNEIHY